jgi:hypothetical protein
MQNYERAATTVTSTRGRFGGKVLRGVPLPPPTKPKTRYKYPFREMLVSECYRLLPGEPGTETAAGGNTRAFNNANYIAPKYNMQFQEVRVTEDSTYASQFPVGTVLIFRVA